MRIILQIHSAHCSAVHATVIHFEQVFSLQPLMIWSAKGWAVIWGQQEWEESKAMRPNIHCVFECITGKNVNGWHRLQVCTCKPAVDLNQVYRPKPGLLLNVWKYWHWCWCWSDWITRPLLGFKYFTTRVIVSFITVKSFWYFMPISPPSATGGMAVSTVSLRIQMSSHVG